MMFPGIISQKIRVEAVTGTTADPLFVYNISETDNDCTAGALSSLWRLDLADLDEVELSAVENFIRTVKTRNA